MIDPQKLSMQQDPEPRGRAHDRAVFDAGGDEAMVMLTHFAEEKDGITAARLTAIGAFSRAVLGYFDGQRKDDERIPVHEQVEVVALVGDVALEDGRPKIHAHVVLGRRDGSTAGGHRRGSRPADPRGDAGAVPRTSRGPLDAESGLALIDVGK